MVSINRAIHSPLLWRRGVHLSSLRSVTALPSLQSLQGSQCSGQEIKPRSSAGGTTAFQCGAAPHSVCTELYLPHHNLFVPKWMHVILGHEMIDNMTFCLQCWKDRLESGRKKKFFSFLTCKITSHSKKQNLKKTVQNPRRKADKSRPHHLRSRPVIRGFSSAHGLLHFGTRNSTPVLGLIPQLFPATDLGFNIGGSVGMTHSTRTPYGKARKQGKKMVGSIKATSSHRDSFKRKRKCLSSGDRSQLVYFQMKNSDPQ